MKASLALKMVLGLLASVTGLSQASAAVDCNSFNLTGTYAPSAGPGTIKISQRGCDLVVKDQAGSIWKFDLSGKTESTLPQRVIKANSTSGEVAKEAMKSTRITMKAIDNGAGDPVIQISVRQHIPRVPDTPLNKGNEIDLDLELSGYLGIYGSGPGTGRIDQVEGLGIYRSKAQIVTIHETKFPAALGIAFVGGANYVLAHTEGMLDNQLSFLNLRRIQ